LLRLAAVQAVEEGDFQDHTYQVLHLAFSLLQIAALFEERSGGSNEWCG
jgi:hypothetical protein